MQVKVSYSLAFNLLIYQEFCWLENDVKRKRELQKMIIHLKIGLEIAFSLS